MTLQDEDGVFLEIEPLSTEDPPPDDPEDADGEEGEAPEPAVVGELRREVERLKTELEAQKSRVRELGSSIASNWETWTVLYYRRMRRLVPCGSTSRK